MLFPGRAFILAQDWYQLKNVKNKLNKIDCVIEIKNVPNIFLDNKCILFTILISALSSDSAAI